MTTRADRPSVPWLLIIAFFALVAVLVYRALTAAPAPTPTAFSQTVSLPEAQQVAAETSRPVLVLVTADWCGPCQRLKKTSLTDPRVAERIEEATVPVYLDATAGVPADLEWLGVQGYPTMLAVRDGKVVSRLVGYRSAADVLQWLESF